MKGKVTVGRKIYLKWSLVISVIYRLL